VKGLDPTVAFLVGVSVGQMISLLLVTGSIKVGEVKALKSLLENKTSRRGPTNTRK
jgi:hypothetical protein